MVLAFKIRVPDAWNIDKTFIFGADSPPPQKKKKIWNKLSFHLLFSSHSLQDDAPLHLTQPSRKVLPSPSLTKSLNYLPAVTEESPPEILWVLRHHDCGQMRPAQACKHH